LDRCEPDDDDRRGRGENQSLAELRSAGRALIDVSRRLHSAIIVRALLLTASREDRREDERTVRLLRGEFSAVARSSLSKVLRPVPAVCASAGGSAGAFSVFRRKLAPTSAAV